MKNLLGIFLLMLVFTSCSTKPEPIQYGSDACHFCKMTIVTKTHAAQAVSSKGKQFKYDAIECLVNDIKMNQNTDMATMLVANFLNAGEMLNAEESNYIISSNIPSPMGANLSAVNTKDEAIRLKNEHEGELYDWEALLNRNNAPNMGQHHLE